MRVTQPDRNFKVKNTIKKCLFQTSNWLVQGHHRTITREKQVKEIALNEPKVLVNQTLRLTSFTHHLEQILNKIFVLVQDCVVQRRTFVFVSKLKDNISGLNTLQKC